MAKSKFTATDFIANHTKPSGYTAGEIVEFIGWSDSGDGGAAQWKATGNVIAASQTPADLGDARLSDASGNEFEITPVYGVKILELNMHALGVLESNTDNADEIQAAINGAGGNPVIGRAGVYKVSKTVAWSTSGGGIKSTTSGYIDIRSASGDFVAARFSPSNPELGELLTTLKIDGLSVSSTAASSTEYLLELTALSSPVINNLRVFGSTKCLRIRGIKDANCTNWLMFAANGSNVYDGSSMIKVGGYPLSGGGYTNAWTTNITNFITSTNGLCDHTVDISQCDGLNITNGYWGRTVKSHLNLQPDANDIGIAKLVVCNVYMDGINTTDGAESCLTVPATGFTGTYIAESKIAGCSLSNVTGDIVDIKGPVQSLSFNGTTLSNAVGKALNWTGGGVLKLVGCDIRNNTGAVVDGARSFKCSSTFDDITGDAISVSNTTSANISGNEFLSVSGQNITKSSITSYKAISNTGTSGDIEDDFGDSGVFTPTLSIGGSSVGITYAEQFGTYQRVGGVINFSVRLKLSSKGGLSGNLFVGGLPIVSPDDSAAALEARNLLASFTGSSLQGLVVSSGVSVSYLSAGVRTVINGDDIADNFEIRISGTYFA